MNLSKDDFIQMLSESCPSNNPEAAAVLQRVLDAVDEGKSVIVDLTKGNVWASTLPEFPARFAFVDPTLDTPA